MTDESKSMHRFKPGNKFGKGRPPGKVTKAVLLRDYATEEEHENALKKLIELAISGDIQALSIYTNMTCGKPKLPSTINLSFAKRINSMADATEVMKDVSYGAMTGQIDLEDAEVMQKIIDATMATIQKNFIDELQTIREKMAVQKKN